MCATAGVSQNMLQSKPSPTDLGGLSARRPLHPINIQQGGNSSATSAKKPQIFKTADVMLKTPLFRPAVDLPLARDQHAVESGHPPGSLKTDGTGPNRSLQRSQEFGCGLVFSTAKGNKIGHSSKAQQAVLSSISGMEWAATSDQLPHGTAADRLPQNESPLLPTRLPGVVQVKLYAGMISWKHVSCSEQHVIL